MGRVALVSAALVLGVLALMCIDESGRIDR